MAVSPVDSSSCLAKETSLSPGSLHPPFRSPQKQNISFHLIMVREYELGRDGRNSWCEGEW